MKITYLGQAGLLFETESMKIIIDPYLSNSVREINPKNDRRVPVDEAFLRVRPDMIVLTHDHLDHTDPETLRHYLTDDTTVTVLASGNAWQTVRKFGGAHNYVMFNRFTEWTEGEILFRAVYAEHSDNAAIGVIVEGEGKVLYITGDTLYNTRIFADLPSHIDYVFLPVNGMGNNMNFADGTRFCRQIGATAIPLHCGLFDGIDPSGFPYEDKIVPAFFKEIPLR